MNNISEMIKKGCLLTSGSIDNFNTMTIGWGMIGTLWRKDVFMCFVRPSRYTYKFIDNNNYFTISFYNENYKKAMGYLGTISGRDEDKVKTVDFHPIEVEKSITFEEAYCTIICEKIYFQDLDDKNIPMDVKSLYYSTEDYHRFYIGKIIKIIEK